MSWDMMTRADSRQIWELIQSEMLYVHDLEMIDIVSF